MDEAEKVPWVAIVRLGEQQTLVRAACTGIECIDGNRFKVVVVWLGKCRRVMLKNTLRIARWTGMIDYFDSSSMLPFIMTVRQTSAFDC